MRLRLEAVLLRWRLPELLVPRKDGLTPKVQHPFCDPRMLPEVLARSTWEAVSDLQSGLGLGSVRVRAQGEYLRGDV